MRIRVISAVFCLSLLGASLAGCSDHAPATTHPPGTITGVVSAPNPSQFASAGSGGVLSRIASFVMATVYADITGLTPVAGATVELVQLNSAGAVAQVLQTTTTDSNGVYTFTGAPAVTDSSLAVRVQGQTNTMRAFVTGNVVNVSPATEVVVTEVLASLSGSVSLGNFTVGEVAALYSLLQGMDHDITGLTFDQAVTTIQTDAGPLFSQLLAAFSAPGASTALRSGNYSLVDFKSLLRDPAVLPSAGDKGGIELDSGQGPLNFGSTSDQPTLGFVAFGTFLHDLTSVQSDVTSDSAFPDVIPLTDLLHVANSKGQVVVADTADPTVTAAGIGAMTTNGSVLVYPIDESLRVNGALSVFGMGIRFVSRWFQPNGQQVPLDLSLVDPTNGTTGTTFHQVGMKEVLAGQGSDGNYVTLLTTVGDIVYNSTPAQENFDETKSYGTFNVASAATDGIKLNLPGFAIDPVSSTDALSGYYYVFPTGGQIQYRDPTGAVLGFGSTPVDGVRNGQIVGGHTFSGGFDATVTKVDRSFSIAIRQASGLTNSQVSGTYNLVQYTTYVSGNPAASPPTGDIENAVRYGTVVLDGSGNVGANSLFEKRSVMNLANAAPTAVSNSSGPSGAFTTATAGAADETFSLVVGGVTVFTFTSAAGGDQVTAADIDTALGNATVQSNLSGAGFTVSGTVAGGNLVFTKSDGTSFVITVTNGFTGSVSATGGFTGTDFTVGTHTVNNGTPATPNLSGASGAFTTATAGAANETFSLVVGPVTVFTFTSAAGGDQVTAANIDTALGNATVQSNLTAAGITFSGTVAGGDLVFTKNNGTSFAIAVTNQFTGTQSLAGGFAGADFAVGTHTVNNGTPATPATSGAAGTFSTATAGAVGETYSLVVGGVTVFSFTSSAGGETVAAADIQGGVDAQTSNLNTAGITVSGTVVGGDLTFTNASGAGFSIDVTDTFSTDPGGFDGSNSNFIAVGSPHTINNGTLATASVSGSSGAFTTGTAGAAGETFSLVVGGVTVFSFTSSAGGDTVTAADIQGGLDTTVSSLSGVGITHTGTVAGGDVVFRKADGTSFDIVVTNQFTGSQSLAGGFAGTDFAVGTSTVNNGTPAVPNGSSVSGTFSTAKAGAANETFSLVVGGVTVFSFTSSTAGDTVTAADIQAGINGATSSLAAAGITASGTVAGGDLAFTKADGTSFAVVVTNGFTGTDSLAGGFAGGDFAVGSHTINNGSAATQSASLSSTSGQQSASAGSYAASGNGTMTLNLTIGSESVSGTGAATQSGDFVALAVATDDSTRKGRGILVLIRQP